MKRSVTIAAAALLCVSLGSSLATTAFALVVCAKDDRTGRPKINSKLVLRESCEPGKEVYISEVPGGCPPDAVAVGTVCIDKYEASVWETSDLPTIKRILDGTIDSAANLGAATQHGSTTDDYGTGCPNTAAGCTTFFAVSIPGVIPSSHITWFQAQAACRNAGKRLATSAEWQAAAYGTPDPSIDANTTTDCNLSASSLGAVNTGSRANCVSDAGVHDMIGNVTEWLADWGDLATDCTAWSSEYGGDYSCMGTSATVNLPGAYMRGGGFRDDYGGGVFNVNLYNSPSFDSDEVGFRCAR